MEAIRDCESLIGAAARAFYTDECVAVLDALVRDKYIREDEMAARLRMSARQARKILQLLEGERLIEQELLNVGQDGSLVKKKRLDDDDERRKIPPAPSEIYWYVDLRKFCDVVRWRVHVMRETLKAREKQATEKLSFKCARCGQTYSVLDANRFAFKCRERLCADEGDAVLAEIPLESHLQGARALGARVDEQLGADERLGRVGVFELLMRLDGRELPHNRPSENRERGVGGWLGAGDRLRERDAGAPKTLNADGTISAVQPRGGSGLGSALFARNAQGQTVTVDLGTGDGDENPASPREGPAKDSSMPDFLRGSRVLTAKELLEADESDDDDDEPDAAHAGAAYRAAKAEAEKEPDGGGRGGAVTLGARGGWGDVVVDAPPSPPKRHKAGDAPPPPPPPPPDDDDDSVMWE